jgi:hypothetical protein
MAETFSNRHHLTSRTSPRSVKIPPPIPKYYRRFARPEQYDEIKKALCSNPVHLTRKIRIDKFSESGEHPLAHLASSVRGRRAERRVAIYMQLD